MQASRNVLRNVVFGRGDELMSENLKSKVARLERENAELREALERAEQSLSQHESGDAFKSLKTQRDILLMFARSCERWAPVDIGARANAAMDIAGLGDRNGDLALKNADSLLAVQLLIRG